MKAELVLDARATLGEGALWHDGRLLWVDIEGCLVCRFDPRNGRNESWNVGQRSGTVVPRAAGGLLVAVQQGIGRLDPATGAFAVFVEPERGRDDVRFNDGKCDPRGRFFAGTMALTKPRGKRGALFRLDPDGAITRVISDVGTSNGLAWSHDEQTFYFIDTPTHEVSAFDYDAESGAISRRRAAVRFADEQHPDGMTIDAAGNLWVALWGGWGVVCCDPRTGKILEKIEVAASQTTSCAFGGPDLQSLYITSARNGLDAATLRNQPAAGGIFVARPGVRGVAAFAFAG